MIYIIRLSFPVVCDAPSIVIGDKENIFTDTVFFLPMVSRSERESIFMNTDSTELLAIMRQEIPSAPEKPGIGIAEKLTYLQTLYKTLSAIYLSDLARDILNDRSMIKYTSPVNGFSLPSKDILIPGANRGYRRDTTDGIHHGWDIMAPFGTPVHALSKGKIVRIIDNWGWNDLAQLTRGNLQEDDKLQNLNIFRGNQVWLQAMDGNVVFYSHLSKISPDIAVGSLVDAGTYLGNIGVSGVPEKNYKNIHLHFEIQQNPFHEDMKTPTYLDIMRWDYIGKHLGNSAIHEKMQEIFE